MNTNPAKTLVLNGASGALGMAVLERALAEGYKVVAFARSESAKTKIEQAARNFANAGHAQVLAGPMDKPAEVIQLAERAHQVLGTIGACVNCAGTFRWAMCEESTEEDYVDLMDSNVKSSWMLARAVLPGMRKAGGGSIVFVSSFLTLGEGTAGMGLYLAAKAAVNAFTQTLAKENRAHKIRVNAILPDIIDTPVNREAMPKADRSSWIPTADLASLVVGTLLHPTSACLSGALLPVPPV